MVSHVTLGNLIVDRDRYQVWVGKQRVALTYVEFELLFCLARNSGRVMPRGALLEEVWGTASEGDAKKLTVHISRLRKKIRDSHPWQIRTVTKRGYALANVGLGPEPNGGRRPTLVPAASRQALAGGG
jgi:DNA-binding response OmpR family regulator